MRSDGVMGRLRVDAQWHPRRGGVTIVAHLKQERTCLMQIERTGFLGGG